MSILTLAGDVLWILALAIMSSVSRSAWRRIDPSAAIFRVGRTVALATPVVAALAIGAGLVIANRQAAADGLDGLILFCARATFAALCALLDLRWVKAVTDAASRQGALKP